LARPSGSSIALVRRHFLPRFFRGTSYWLASALTGGVALTLVYMFVVVPLKTGAMPPDMVGLFIVGFLLNMAHKKNQAGARALERALRQLARGWHGGPRGRAWRVFPAPVSEGCFSYLVFADATGTLRRRLSRTNKPAPRPLAIPLRTSENWRPSVAG
jgi:hypothetical protein